MDFLKCIENDLVLNILGRLDDPADLVRGSILSRDWQDFVIGSELSKQLCLRQFPQVANLVDVRDVTIRKRKRADVTSSENGQVLTRNHKVYASLLHALQKLRKSSPSECVKDKHIYVQGMEKEGDFSTKSVRFRMGFPKHVVSKDPDDDDEFIWTYTSPEFPMGEACRQLHWGGLVQRFELPEPVLCIGGFVMVELLGRVQMDAVQKHPYYIKILQVINILGRSLSPAFKAEVQDPSGKFALKYNGGRLRQTILYSFNGRYSHRIMMTAALLLRGNQHMRMCVSISLNDTEIISEDFIYFMIG